MSETVHFKGKLYPTNQTLEEFMNERHPELKGEGLNSDFDDLEEYFIEEHYRDYVIVEDMVFKVDVKDYSYNGIFEMKPNSDGSYDIDLRYYNGGCCFDEAIETAYKRMEDV